MKSPGLRMAIVISTLAILSIALTACGNNESSAAPPESASTASETAEPQTEGEDTDDAHDESESEVADDHGEGTSEMEGVAHDDEEEEHEDMAAAHNIPAEEAARENPVPYDDSSIARGAELFQASCAVCHGDRGRGDGVGGVALDPKPADLTANHVQENTDGSLLYTISNGVEGTAMVAWQGQFSEEDRWHLVNYVRSLPDAE